jgi:hypothetical protein
MIPSPSPILMTFQFMVIPKFFTVRATAIPQARKNPKVRQSSWGNNLLECQSLETYMHNAAFSVNLSHLWRCILALEKSFTTHASATSRFMTSLICSGVFGQIGLE